jgi:hypothetical protein
MSGKIRLVGLLAIVSLAVMPLLAQAEEDSSDKDVLQVVVQEGTTATSLSHGVGALRITNPTSAALCANIYAYTEGGKISCCASCPVAPLASLDTDGPGHSASFNSTFIISGAPPCNPTRPAPEERLRTWMVIDEKTAVGFPAQSAPLESDTLHKLKTDCAQPATKKCSCKS